MREYEERDINMPAPLRYLPILWAALMSIGMAVLILQIWTDYKTGPNYVLKIMYSVIGIGGCGTYSGFVSIVRTEPTPIYRALRYCMYVLAFLIGVETLDALWTVEYLSSDDTGESFVWIAVTVGVVAVVFWAIAAILYGVQTSSPTPNMSRVIGLIVYAALGMVGFTVAVVALWNSLGAGALRFILGATAVLAITTAALILAQLYYDRPVVDEPDDESTNEPPWRSTDEPVSQASNAASTASGEGGG